MLFGFLDVIAAPYTYLLVAVIAGLVVFLLVRRDSRIEDRRRDVKQIEDWCNKWGLTQMAKLLDAYTVGDYSGMVRAVHEALAGLDTEAEREAHAKQILLGQLKVRIPDKALREDLALELNKMGYDLVAKSVAAGPVTLTP
jgi:hypothetical protein